MLGSTVLCTAAFGIALSSPPAAPALSPAPVPDSRSEPRSSHPVSEWLAAGVRVAGWLRPGPVFARLDNGLGVYHARARPAAEARFWLATASDFWMSVNHPACHGLLASPAAPWFTDPSAISVRPVPGDQSSAFGYRYHPILKRRRLHKGLDFKGARGTPVKAAGPGRVTFAGRRGSYGNLVVIDHGLGLETRYAHLQRIRTRVDDLVPPGEEIGTIGTTGRSTGPHLHFEVRQFGQPFDPSWVLGLGAPTLLDRARTLVRFLSAE